MSQECEARSRAQDSEASSGYAQAMKNPALPELPPYEFSVLKQQDEIRLLELCNTKERIECRIVHAPLPQANFQALSYVWGSLDQKHRATVVDAFDSPIGHIPLTDNLHNALCDLRDTAELDCKVFWMDQICINQRDDEEKNHQVALMHAIYTQASRVIIYVGPAVSERSERTGLALLRQLEQCIPQETLTIMNDTRKLGEIYNMTLEGKIKLSPLPVPLRLTGQESFMQIETLYKEQGWEWVLGVSLGEWSRRLWIVQEQLLNKEVIMLRGKRLLDWNVVVILPILFLLGLFPREYYRIAIERAREKGVDLFKVSTTLFSLWRERKSRTLSTDGTTWRPLLENMSTFEYHLCNDIRDRVYALLAISEDVDRLGLEPDYSESNTPACLAVSLSARAFSTATELTALVFSCRWRLPNSTLPSWSITLDHPSPSLTPATFGFETWEPHPCTSIVPQSQPKVLDSVLVLKGRLLDRICSSEKSRFWPTHISYSNYDTNAIQVDAEWLSDITKLSHGKVKVDEAAALCRTLASHHHWDPPSQATSSSTKVMALHFRDYYQTHTSSLQGRASEFNLNLTDVGERCKSTIARLEDIPLDNTMDPTLQPSNEGTSIATTSYGKVRQYELKQARSLSRTQSGRPCNAMHDVEAGDAVAAFQGSDRLWILRPVGNQYRLIGDAYVDGLMDGEAYEGLDPEEVDYDIEII